MKVLQVSKFFPPVRGGIESAVRELSDGLNRAGVPTDVLCAHQRLATEHQRTEAGYEVVRAASWGMLLSTSVAPSLALQLRRMAPRYDLLHVHMPDPMAALALWWARPRARVVLHWHSDVIRQRHALRLYRPLQDWLLRRADAVIATSEAYAEASAPLRPWRHKVCVIPIGIGDNHSPADSAKAAELRRRYRGRKIVFALGRMTYYKGFEVLVEAAAAMADDTVVLIGGDGDLMERYRSLVSRRGLAGKVHLLGAIDDEDLPAHFEACDVFCLPSIARSEAYGIAMVEAMMMARPIVATEIPGSGVPWVNVDGVTGCNVPPLQPAPLAASLTRLLGDDALRQRQGAAARRRYLEEFTADTMTRRTMDLYRDLPPAASP